ncbi:MAG: M23 family metallopeptidase [Candidatus Gracilibacteria bacterium]
MYPYILLNKNIDIFPIFGNKLKTIGFALMNDNSKFMEELKDYEIKDQKLFNNQILKESSSDIIISGYLEKRLRLIGVLGCKQMVEQERYYHLGLDLSIRKGTSVFAPLPGIIYKVGYEEGDGNYGGYIILKHNIDGNIFYSFYGHLSYKNIFVNEGKIINPGDKLGIIGDFNENGGYFHHLHLQVITKLGKINGFFSKGYCTKIQCEDIYKYTPDPTFLFNY